MIDLSGLSTEFHGKAYRIVESQEKVATMKLVDTLDEQIILEELIEKNKPSIPEKNQRHYLIQTPFRYPPIKHGSRFGSRFEPSIFYAGKSLKSALCESAFYSFYFMSRSIEPYDKDIMNHKTSFSVEIQDSHHIELTKISNPEITKKLIHKSDYRFAQLVGKQLREDGIASFSFFSARCDEQINIGVFDINAIIGEPETYLNWEIKQTPDNILFYCATNSKLSKSFNKKNFLMNGDLPSPSA